MGKTLFSGECFGEFCLFFRELWKISSRNTGFSFEKARKSDFEREDKIAIRADPERPHYSEMLLDDPDALKTWLTDYLQPM